MSTVFKNEFDEMRSGWQMAIFVLVFGIISAVVIVPLDALFNIRDPFSISAASLIAVLLTTYLATKFINRKPVAAVGLAVNKHSMREFGIGCLAGWLMMTGIFGVEYALGYVKVVAVEVTTMESLRTFGFALVFFGVGAMVEEVLFRGYLFQTFVRGVNFIPAVIVTGILFGLVHLRNPNASALGFANTVLVSIMFCYAYWRTRGLWLPFGIHFAWNFSQTTFYGFPTSGMHFSNQELTRLTQFGPEWITGGMYGPEGGILATFVIVLCGVYCYYSRALQPRTDVVTLERKEERLRFQMFESRALMQSGDLEMKAAR